VNLIFFTHPDFEGHQSMPRFAGMLANGMRQRGHTVEVWSPAPKFYRLPGSISVKKWLGYIDQFILFPLVVKKKLKSVSQNSLFVFTDQALGPWVPLVADRPHVIHCHDFLAQQSALGEIPENPTKRTGRVYQRMIHKGYSMGKNFISVSNNTKAVLHRFLEKLPEHSEVVYNGLNQSFVPSSVSSARDSVGKAVGLDLTAGFLLHVGGNQWYKNREGVVKIYNAWRTRQNKILPLLLIGEIPNQGLHDIVAKSPYKSDIYILSGINDKILRDAYVGASVFLFPSKAEGFGWPIAEAMASGCPVITTNEAPMTEVAGTAGFLISKEPWDKSKINAWASEGAAVLDGILMMSDEERRKVIERGLDNAKRFDTQAALDRIEKIYKKILHEV
jgi:glycosyltransferase involved in cell wall biosynthesis